MSQYNREFCERYSPSVWLSSAVSCVRFSIAFSYRAWNGFNLPTGDNYLAEKVEMYLTATGQNDIHLVTLRMKDKSDYKKWEKTG